MAVLFKGDKEQKVVHPKGSTFSLEELYELLDCDTVHIISLNDVEGLYTGKFMVIDDEAKLKPDFKPNFLATPLYWAGRIAEKDFTAYTAMLEVLGAGFLSKAGIDFIAGAALVCNKNELE